jgi:hypothetical protein
MENITSGCPTRAKIAAESDVDSEVEYTSIDAEISAKQAEISTQKEYTNYVYLAKEAAWKQQNRHTVDDGYTYEVSCWWINFAKVLQAQYAQAWAKLEELYVELYDLLRLADAQEDADHESIIANYDGQY